MLTLLVLTEDDITKASDIFFIWKSSFTSFCNIANSCESEAENVLYSNYVYHVEKLMTDIIRIDNWHRYRKHCEINASQKCGNDLSIFRIEKLKHKDHNLQNVTVIYTDYIYFYALCRELSKSSVYRKLFLKNFKREFGFKSSSEVPVDITFDSFIIRKPIAFILLSHNIPHFIDYNWGYRCNQIATVRQHLDSVMSWLSTLGGGFSALGDYDINFAEKAGDTSIKQMIVACRLGDQNLIARCWLYYALSLIQKKKYKKAAVIVKYEYQWASSHLEGKLDHRLKNMCKGIWTKLKYEHSQYKCNSLSRRV